MLYASMCVTTLNNKYAPSTVTNYLGTPLFDRDTHATTAAAFKVQSFMQTSIAKFCRSAFATAKLNPPKFLTPCFNK